MPTLTINGTPLYHEEHGSGPALLLIHGTGGYADVFAPVLDGLARRFRVIVYDRRGFARSPSSTPWHLADQTRDAAQLLTMLDASPAIVVGWSGGGVIALDLAATFPDCVRSLVLAEAAAHLTTHPRRGMLAMGARMAFRRSIRRDPRGAALAMYRWASGYQTGANGFDLFPRAWQDQMLEHAPATLREMDKMLIPRPSRTAIRTITCPVTMIAGQLSDPSFAAATAFLMGLIPQARLVTIPGAGHMLHVDQPKPWIEAVTSSPGRLSGT